MSTFLPESMRRIFKENSVENLKNDHHNRVHWEPPLRLMYSDELGIKIQFTVLISIIN